MYMHTRERVREREGGERGGREGGRERGERERGRERERGKEREGGEREREEREERERMIVKCDRADKKTKIIAHSTMTTNIHVQCSLSFLFSSSQNTL